MMWNCRILVLLHFLVWIVSVQCPLIGQYLFQYDFFRSSTDDDGEIDEEMMAYWKSGLIDPDRDAVYEEFFRLAKTCHRFVSTVDEYRQAYPEKYLNDDDNFEILKRSQAYAVFHACENIIGIVVSYYEALKNEGHTLPDYVLVDY